MTSDLRAKKDIRNLDNGLSLVKALRPVRYRWKSGKDSDLKLGLIAQEVESIIPEVVHVPENESEYYGLNYAELVPVLIRAIQEQQIMIEAQKTMIEAQQAEMGVLRAIGSDQNSRLAALETQLQP